uniref:Uncharacterized protein n=1 Tax=Arundo donax TaxID=35708 RepID=A0A0A9HHM0_ARUDO
MSRKGHGSCEIILLLLLCSPFFFFCLTLVCVQV